jgi:hypothetical protein
MPWLDIHSVLSDRYILSFDLSLFIHCLCVKHGYIGFFELSWICFVFFQVDGFFESFNRHKRTFIGLKWCMN